MICLNLIPETGFIKCFPNVLLPTWKIKNMRPFNVTITEIGFAKCETKFFKKRILDKRKIHAPMEIIQEPHQNNDFYSLPFTLGNNEIIEIAYADMKEIEYAKNNSFNCMYVIAGDYQLYSDAKEVLTLIDTTHKTYRKEKNV